MFWFASHWFWVAAADARGSRQHLKYQILKEMSFLLVLNEFSLAGLSIQLPTFSFYTRFQCYVHRRHIRSSFDMPSFDMLCNLAHIKMIRQRTLLRSKSTFSHSRWNFLDFKLRFRVSRSHSLKDNWLFYMFTSFEHPTRSGLNCTGSQHWELIDSTQIVQLSCKSGNMRCSLTSSAMWGQ